MRQAKILLKCISAKIWPLFLYVIQSAENAEDRTSLENKENCRRCAFTLQTRLHTLILTFLFLVISLTILITLKKKLYYTIDDRRIDWFRV